MALDGSSPSRIVVAAVDDHPVMLAGLTRLSEVNPQITYGTSASSVDALLATGSSLDVVLLALRLADGSPGRQNVEKLVAAGARVLVYTEGDRAAWIADAIAAGALGVIVKSSPLEQIAEAVVTVHAGDTFLTPDVADALARDAASRPTLSERELEVLRAVGLGLADKQIARQLGISEETVKEYLRRLRAKYVERGRTVRSRVDLFRRSLEDGVAEPPGDSDGVPQ